MKRVLRIAVLAVLSVLFSADSCSRQEDLNESRETNSAENAKDSLVSIFTADNLSPRELTAFEEKAVQEFNDLLDFTAIAADTSMAIEFREQAGKMARDLFLYRDSINLQIGHARPTLADSVWIAAPLIAVEHDHYTGKLGFSPAALFNAGSRGNGPGTMEFHLVKRSRVFGADTLNVWTVLLGGIR